MKHADSTESMALGLMYMIEYFLGAFRKLAEEMGSYEFDMRAQRSEIVNGWLVTRKMMVIVVTRCNNTSKPLRKLIEDRGWKVPSPDWLPMPAVPVVTEAFTGDGWCEECVKQDPVELEFDRNDCLPMLQEVINEAWRLFTLHEGYRKHQLAKLEESGHFGEDEDAYLVEDVYVEYGKDILEGLHCLGKSVEIVSAYGHGVAVPDAVKIDRELRRAKPDAIVTDVAWRRNWCATCTANRVFFEPDVLGIVE